MLLEPRTSCSKFACQKNTNGTLPYNGTKTFIATRIDVNAMLQHCTLLKKPILESYGFSNRSDTLKIARNMYLSIIVTIGHKQN